MDSPYLGPSILKAIRVGGSYLVSKKGWFYELGSVDITLSIPGSIKWNNEIIVNQIENMNRVNRLMDRLPTAEMYRQLANIKLVIITSVKRCGYEALSAFRRDMARALWWMDLSTHFDDIPSAKIFAKDVGARWKRELNTDILALIYALKRYDLEELDELISELQEA